MATPTVQPAKQWLGENRRMIAYVLLAIAVVIGIASAFAFVSASSSISVPSATGGEPSSIPNPLKNEYLSLGIAGILLTITALGAGIWFFIDRPKDDAIDRLAILITGACYCLALCMLAIFLFYWWFPELTKWVVGEEKAAAWKPVSSLLLFLFGIGIAFLAAQPATRDQRDNPLTRRMIYGVNLALTVSVLGIALVAANILVNLKLPGRLDTTENNLTTISDATKNYVSQLSDSITLYTWMDESSEAGRLLERIRDANPQKVTIRNLNPTRDRSEFVRLREKYKSTGLVDQEGAIRSGVLMVNDTRDGRAAFIAASEFYAQERDQRGRPGPTMFRGEARMARDLLFLTDNKQKPVIYFTQNAGELQIESQPNDPLAANARRAETLKSALVADGCEVKALKIDALGDARIPTDASIVVVADPAVTLAPATVLAIQQFMSAGKGKLIVMAGAHPGKNGNEVIKIGLEEFLASAGVELMPRVLYAQPTNDLPPDQYAAAINRTEISLNKEVVTVLENVRPILPMDRQNPHVKLLSLTIEDRTSWLETSVSPNPFQSFERLVNAAKNKDNKYLAERMAADGKQRRITAVTVTDPKEGTPRMAVFGFGNYFADKDNNTEFSEHSYILTSTVNWLRERPALANETNKPVGMYTANPRMNFYTVFLFPVVGSLTIVIAAGVCVWALRRK